MKEILAYTLIIWGISGVIIALVSWLTMCQIKGQKYKLYWNGLLDFLHMFVIIAVLSYIWIGFLIYWEYEHKREMRKINQQTK